MREGKGAILTYARPLQKPHSLILKVTLTGLTYVYFTDGKTKRRRDRHQLVKTTNHTYGEFELLTNQAHDLPMFPSTSGSKLLTVVGH